MSIELGNQIRTVKVQVTTPASRQRSFQERFQISNKGSAERGLPTAIQLKGKRKTVPPSKRGT